MTQLTKTYESRRGWLENYFDRTAADAWAKLTSDGPVSKIRATVRAGRDRMRNTLLDYLPQDLSGRRVLDAGCGTGALAMEAALRGADVVAIDLSATLVDLARQRTAEEIGPGRVDYRVGDMLDPSLGLFDHVVCMDSLIHYRVDDMVAMVERLSERSRGTVAFTFAPRTFLLSVMHLAGKLFPRRDRAPQIEPARERTLRRRLAASPGLNVVKTDRVSSGFYISQAMLVEVTR
ncbi:MAG: magnesium protoporphyrin IX methyltransferase [Myxococcota bacterium]